MIESNTMTTGSANCVRWAGIFSSRVPLLAIGRSRLGRKPTPTGPTDTLLDSIGFPASVTLPKHRLGQGDDSGQSCGVAGLYKRKGFTKRCTSPPLPTCTS